MPDDFISSCRFFDERNIKELLGVINTVNMGAVERRLAESGVRHVTITAPVPMSEYSIVLDYAKMAELAVEMLKEHEHRDFAVFYFDAMRIPADDFDRRLCEEHSLVPRRAVGFREDRLVKVCYSPNLEDVYDSFKRWWSRSDRPSAIFFYDDGLCDVVTRAILELGIKVPEELAIITMANVGRQFHFPVPLTSIGFDPAEVASAAWDMLDKLISNKPIDNPVSYISPVVHRGRSLGEKL
ncbi:MAG: substrate-binding domain-containing protein [Armatimonadota bacterium]